MPYLQLNTNLAVDAEQSQQLLTECSRLLAKETSKPERYVMVEINPGKAMLFGDGDQPLAYLECKSIGLSASQARSLSASLTTLLTAHLPLSADRIYIEFSNCAPEFWGWNGSTFA